MRSLQALREQRAAKAITLRDLLAKEDYNPERDNPIYDAAMSEIESLDDQIKRIVAANEKLAEETIDAALEDATARAVKDKGGTPALALFNKWLRGGEDAFSAEDWQTFRNTMSTTTTTEGGYTVAQEWANTVLEALKAFGGMRAVSSIIQTSGVGQLNYPTSDGTSEVGEIIAENQTATGADISFGTKSLVAYKYSSKVVAVPFELLQDSNVDIEGLVRARLAMRLGRITNTHFTTGTGTAQPTGIVTATSAGVTLPTGNTTSLTYDGLVDLVHSLDPAYRISGCKFMMNDATLKAARKVKDSQSRPIFVPGYETGVPGGAPDSLLGYGIQINQDMAVPAANAKSILFGDFGYYVIRDVMAVEMFRFNDSAYTKLGQVGFLAWMRSGGNFIDVGGAVKQLVQSAT